MTERSRECKRQQFVYYMIDKTYFSSKRTKRRKPRKDPENSLSFAIFCGIHCDGTSSRVDLTDAFLENARMPRLSRNALSAAKVRTAGPGSYVDGNGLMLRVKARGTRQWVQRITIHGRRVDLGLGSAELVSLADARRVAAENRAVARTGGDPRRARVPTFAQAEAACFAERLETWRTDSPARSWRGTVDRHVLPRLGGVPVDQVGTAAVYEVLRPLAVSGRHATARAAGAAITAVLGWARIHEHRTEGSPVETVRRSLPRRAAGPKHHEALHWQEVGSALARIDATGCAASTKRAIRFAALTAARQVEVRRATWDQLDLEGAVWTKPAESAKTGRAHRVPLSDQALAVLRGALADTCGRGLAFPGSRPGAMLGDRVMTQALRGAGIAASGHGFRSSFKDWARQHEVDELLSEFALAHVEGSATVAAYARDDLLERRRPVMQQWADAVAG